MKKTITIIAISLFTLNLSAQQIDITDIFFTAPNDNPTNALNDTTLEPGDTVTLWFVFQNNLSNSQGLAVGDSLTFGWEIGGANQGSLIMDSLNVAVANGGSLNGYLRNNYVLPTTKGTKFSICTWPLYNPYEPNTNDQVGRHCTQFMIKADPPEQPTSVDLINSKKKPNLYINNRMLHYQLNSSQIRNIELVDLTGKVAFETMVENQSGVIQIGANIPTGIYMLKISESSNYIIEKVFVQ